MVIRIYFDWFNFKTFWNQAAVIEGKEMLKAEEKKTLDIMNKNQIQIQQLQKEYEDNVKYIRREFLL